MTQRGKLTGRGRVPDRVVIDEIAAWPQRPTGGGDIPPPTKMVQYKGEEPRPMTLSDCFDWHPIRNAIRRRLGKLPIGPPS